jgi:hypothetical protein
MKRRDLIGALCAISGASLTPFARAHHGWSGFDLGRPLYLEGRVRKVLWQNPHAELDIEVPAALKLPPDLAQRALPAQSAAVDGKALLARAVLPTRRDRRWEIELAPLTRLQAWKVAEIQPGAQVSVLGFSFAGEKGEAVLRAEYLFVDGKAYGLRSSPA